MDKALSECKNPLKINKNDEVANYDVILLLIALKKYGMARKHIDFLEKDGLDFKPLIEELENKNNIRRIFKIKKY